MVDEDTVCDCCGVELAGAWAYVYLADTGERICHECLPGRAGDHYDETQVDWDYMYR